MYSEILDESALEHLVKWHNEDEVEFTAGLEVTRVVRDGNKIVWTTRREATEKIEVDEVFVRVPTWLGVVDAVRIWGHTITLFEGDQLVLTYTLEWDWYSRDDDDNLVLLPGPAEGAELRFEFCLAA